MNLLSIFNVALYLWFELFELKILNAFLTAIMKNSMMMWLSFKLLFKNYNKTLIVKYSHLYNYCKKWNKKTLTLTLT